MGPVEIVIIVVAVLVVVGSLITYIVRKAKGKPTGSCAGCPYAGSCKSGSCHSSQHIDLSQYENDNNGKSDNGDENN